MFLLICLAFVGLCAGEGNFTDIFEQTIDTNKNKILDLPEFQALFDQNDLNKDGQVSLAENLKSTGTSGKGATAFFTLLDPNKDGVIHRPELPAVLSKFDVNGDGTVTEEEFIKRHGELYNTAHGTLTSVGK
ncbi:calmodulin-4-like [Haliotis rubra]|uniref:calmodulin-4-like n=1 Tax=Haliotis rubra TaxID=36100 RepID=UPI001EE51D8A|nr:calmodulin-4-like [Haliotis rubra]